MLKANKLTTLLGGLLLLSSVEASATSFNFQTVDDPKDTTFNQLLGINNAGTIAGYFGSGADANHPNKGFTIAPSYVAGGTFTNENFPRSLQTQITGINNNGLTVGFWVDGGGNNFGFVDNKGVFTKVVNPLSPTAANGTPQVNQLLAVNDYNLAAGFYLLDNGNSQAYTYNINTAKFSPVNIGARSTTAAAINNAGDVGGFYNSGNTTQGFILSGGKLVSLQYPNATSTQVLGLNNTGLADGVYTDSKGVMHGFLYNRATKTFTSVDAPNDANGQVQATTLNGLNDKSQLTGFFVDGKTNGLLVTVTTPSPADCLFNWAEQNYPGFFPASSATQFFPANAYRHYKSGNTYLSVSFDDEKVYFGSNGEWRDIGALSGWLAQAKCQ
jgi:hypothetical protein